MTDFSASWKSTQRQDDSQEDATHPLTGPGPSKLLKVRKSLSVLATETTNVDSYAGTFHLWTGKKELGIFTYGRGACR